MSGIHRLEAEVELSDIDFQNVNRQVKDCHILCNAILILKDEITLHCYVRSMIH